MAAPTTAASAATTTTTTTTAPASSGTAPKVVLHWLNDSRAQRIAWLFEELGLDYDIEVYYRQANKTAPPELKAIHPLGRSPVVTIPSENLTLAESGFIIQYFTSRFQKLQPDPKTSSPAVLNHFNYLLHFGEGTLMPPLTIAYILEQLRQADVPFFIKPVTNKIVAGIYNAYLTKTLNDNFEYLEKLLEGKKWFVEDENGEGFSGIDILLSYPLLAAKSKRVKGFTKEKFPKLWAWTERVEQREAFKRAEARTKNLEKSSS